jgi:phosphoribosylformimino-5-aminoimidazole carboxamide ribotide isomerase
MKIFPAIDIINGKCVRLTQGNYDSEKIYGEYPIEIAKTFQSYGATHLHVIDLDAAINRNSNYDIIKEMATSTHLKIQVGGGISNENIISKLLDNGIWRVIVGSMAVRNKEMVFQWIRKFGSDKIVIGADIKDGYIAIDGWKKITEFGVKQFIEIYLDNGAELFLCTAIENDGMLKGIKQTIYEDVMKSFPSIKLIASGGVADEQDIELAKRLDLEGIVVGKALYEKKIDYKVIFNKYGG